MEENKLSIQEIANIESLGFVETTNQANGYPSNLEYVLIDFNHWGHLESVLNKYPYLEPIKLHRKEGWIFWVRKGDINSPFYISGDDYGDDYKIFEGGLCDDYYQDEIKPRLENFDTFEDLMCFVENQKKIFEQIERASDDEIVIVCEGKYYDTVEKETLSFHHDTNCYLIGLINI